jgi:hypothetical protein
MSGIQSKILEGGIPLEGLEDRVIKGAVKPHDSKPLVPFRQELKPQSGFQTQRTSQHDNFLPFWVAAREGGLSVWLRDGNLP